ncbi:MAG: radical SAM protein [Myxococcota bacterium]
MWRALEQLVAMPPAEREALRAEHRRGASPWLTSAKLKLVDGCNLRCFMCDYWKRDRQGELTTDEVVAVLRDLAALGCRKVHYTGGELFLRRDAVQLVAEASALGMRTNLTTNGTVLDKARLDALLDVPVRSVTLSVDSPVPAVHDALRGQAGAFKRTVKILDRILARRGRKTRVRLNTVVSRRNLGTLVQMVPFLRERPVDGWLLIPVDGPDPLRSPDTGLDAGAIAVYNARVAPILAESVRVPGFDPWIYGRTDAELAESAAGRYARGAYQRGRCHVPWFHVLVGPDGDVYPCCTAHRRMPPLGNVRQQPLHHLRRRGLRRALRRQMLVERMALCHGCDDFLAENRALDEALGEPT